MSKRIQATKNLDLSQKLAEYIASNPETVKNLPKKSTFVVFSSVDKKLNAENKKLIDSILAEGKKVVKAAQTKDRFNPWKFSPIAY